MTQILISTFSCELSDKYFGADQITDTHFWQKPGTINTGTSEHCQYS